MIQTSRETNDSGASPPSAVQGRGRVGGAAPRRRDLEMKHFEILIEITWGRSGKCRPGGTTRETLEDTGKKTIRMEVGAAGGEEREW